MKMKLMHIALLLLTLVAGCHTGVKKPYYGRSDHYERTQIFFSGTFGDQLEKSTAVGQAIMTFPDGLMCVTIPIRSAVDNTLYVEYQVTYLDGSGQQLNQVSWQPITLEANVPNEVSFKSIDTRAKDFRCAFRFVR